MFRITVPACERDDFQRWETDKPVKWIDIPVLEREMVLRLYDADGNDIDAMERGPSLETDNGDAAVTGLWVRGRYSRQQVDTWYETSLRYWFSFVMSIV